jgi:DNA-binding transcriptional regulator YiaG
MLVDRKKFRQLLKDETFDFSSLIQISLQFFHITENRLARKLGVSASTVGRWNKKKSKPILSEELFLRKSLTEILNKQKDSIDFQV